MRQFFIAQMKHRKENMKMNYDKISQFERNFKKLKKKFRSLPQDLEIVKVNAIELYHIIGIDNEGVFSIPKFCSDRVKVYKLRKFACRTLKSRGSKSGIRLIYAFYPKQKKVVFLEIYFKGDKVNEDKTRIKEYLKSINGIKS